MNAPDFITAGFSILLRVTMIIFVSLFSLLINNALGQIKAPCEEITEDMGFTVSSVQILGRWVPKELQKRVEEMIGISQLYSSAKVMSAQRLVADELDKGKEFFGSNLKIAVEVTYLTWDACDISDIAHLKEVEIIIHPYYLRIDLYNIGNNILPVPRSAKSSFLTNVPKVLLVTSPLLVLSNDRKFGFSAMVQTITDLLHIPGLSKIDKGSKNFKLNLEFNGQKSFNNPFYEVGAELNLQHIKTVRTIGWQIGIQYANSLQPLGGGEFRRGLTKFYASIENTWKSALLHTYTLGLDVRYTDNKYYLLLNKDYQNLENGYDFYALSDGRLGGGFTRLGAWFNKAAPKNIIFHPYQQLASRFAYGISLGRKHNYFDLEAGIGGGYSWGAPPPYSLFYAGNTNWNFLYEPLASQKNRAFPNGAIVRSLGLKEGGIADITSAIQGGTSYWHLNGSFSIPIPKWSRPLIPDINNFQNIIKTQAVKSAIVSINEDMINREGLPDTEETTKKAEQIVDKDITPVINYVTDRASIYSVKPILLFDLAKIKEQSLGNITWFATGLGVQLNIVVARFETGYMHTVFPAVHSNKGNFFLRFTFQNFY